MSVTVVAAIMAAAAAKKIRGNFILTSLFLERHRKLPAFLHGVRVVAACMRDRGVSRENPDLHQRLAKWALRGRTTDCELVFRLRQSDSWPTPPRDRYPALESSSQSARPAG